MKRLAITIGDPGGIGPEIVLKALLRLCSDGILKDFIPVIIGDRLVLDEAFDLLEGQKIDLIYIKPQEIHTISEADTACFIDLRILEEFKKYRPTPEGGSSAVEYIKLAVELALKDLVHGIVTAPISKTSLRMAGYSWPGHTEMLKELTGAEDVSMLFYAPEGENLKKELRVILTTIHVALKDVPGLITEERVFRTIISAKKASEMFGIDFPKVGVSGLNPHAGEEGLFGDEEKRVIIPAIKKARDIGLNVYGPIPPDVIFYKALEGEFDIIVSMYHDQGLAPLKLVAFERAVNITVGLPIIRTSPDHGTAYDIAWKGIANPSSMAEAIKTALRLKRV